MVRYKSGLILNTTQSKDDIDIFSQGWLNPKYLGVVFIVQWPESKYIIHTSTSHSKGKIQQTFSEVFNKRFDIFNAKNKKANQQQLHNLSH